MSQSHASKLLEEIEREIELEFIRLEAVVEPTISKSTSIQQLLSNINDFDFLGSDTETHENVPFELDSVDQHADTIKDPSVIAEARIAFMQDSSIYSLLPITLSESALTSNASSNNNSSSTSSQIRKSSIFNDTDSSTSTTKDPPLAEQIAEILIHYPAPSTPWTAHRYNSRSKKIDSLISHLSNLQSRLSIESKIRNSTIRLIETSPEQARVQLLEVALKSDYILEEIDMTVGTLNEIRGVVLGHVVDRFRQWMIESKNDDSSMYIVEQMMQENLELKREKGESAVMQATLDIKAEASFSHLKLLHESQINALRDRVRELEEDKTTNCTNYNNGNSIRDTKEYTELANKLEESDEMLEQRTSELAEGDVTLKRMRAENDRIIKIMKISEVKLQEYEESMDTHKIEIERQRKENQDLANEMRANIVKSQNQSFEAGAATFLLDTELSSLRDFAINLESQAVDHFVGQRERSNSSVSTTENTVLTRIISDFKSASTASHSTLEKLQSYIVGLVAFIKYLEQENKSLIDSICQISSTDQSQSLMVEEAISRDVDTKAALQATISEMKKAAARRNSQLLDHEMKMDEMLAEKSALIEDLEKRLGANEGNKVLFQSSAIADRHASYELKMKQLTDDTDLKILALNRALAEKEAEITELRIQTSGRALTSPLHCSLDLLFKEELPDKLKKKHRTNMQFGSTELIDITESANSVEFSNIRILESVIEQNKVMIADLETDYITIRSQKIALEIELEQMRDEVPHNTEAEEELVLSRINVKSLTEKLHDTEILMAEMKLDAASSMTRRGSGARNGAMSPMLKSITLMTSVPEDKEANSDARFEDMEDMLMQMEEKCGHLESELLSLSQENKRFTKLITETKEKLIHNSSYIEDLEFKLNKLEKQRGATQVKGISSKKDLDKMQEFKVILEEANGRYIKSLEGERELRKSNEYEIERLRRMIEVSSESKVAKAVQTTLKWVDGDTPVKASFW